MKYLNEINRVKELISSGNLEFAGQLLDEIYLANPQDYFLENFYGAYLALDSNKENLAIEKFKKSILLNNKFSEPYYNLSRIYFSKNNYLECEFFVKKAISLDTYNLHFKNLLGQTYLKLKKYDQAIILFNIILKEWIDNPEVYYNLGSAYRYKEEYEKAIFFLDKSISLGIDFSQAYIDLSISYEKVKSNYYLNFQLTSKGVKLFNTPLLNILHARNLFKFGEVDESFLHIKKAINLDEDNLSFISLYLFYLNYKSEDIMSEYLEMVSVFRNKYFKSKEFKKINHSILKKPKKIKLGFVSYDFRDHVVMYQLFDIIKELYECSNFILYAYYNNEIEDEITNNVKKYFHFFINISKMKDEEIVNKIINDEIYFLFDLSGFTMGNRLGVFIQKPAPLQISWAGYLNTTGLEEIDYIILDENINTNYFNNYSEKIIKLPYIWTNLSTLGLPNIEKISRRTPALNNNYLTLGCFHNLNKVNRDVKNFIVNILKKFTNSKIIFQSDLFNDQDFKNYFYEKFFQENIVEDRIIFLGTLSRDKFLLKFNEIDIFLDTFPYGGGTTSLEASWMCVPILTREGNTFLSRCGVSINLNLGLEEFIYKNEEDAINLLKKFDTNYNYLQLVKEKLFKQKTNCKLFDPKAFVNALSDQLYDIVNNKR